MVCPLFGKKKNRRAAISPFSIYTLDRTFVTFIFLDGVEQTIHRKWDFYPTLFSIFVLPLSFLLLVVSCRNVFVLNSINIIKYIRNSNLTLNKKKC